MASSKDIAQTKAWQYRQPMAPATQAGLGAHGAAPLSTSAGTNAAGSGLLSRTPNSRSSISHAHSALGTTQSSAHRISRRKSVNGTSATTVAAVAAIHDGLLDATAMQNRGGAAISSSLGAYNRGSAMSAALNGSIGGRPLATPPNSFPTRSFVHPDGSAIDDEGSDGEVNPAGSASGAARRRGSRAELRCKKCGKTYKHTSCLTKHLWEHTPQWALTSRLLISKHQQVQLLEAATVLVGFNKNKPESPPASTRASDSDEEQSFDETNSANTTPPPAYSGGAMTVDSKENLWAPAMSSSVSQRSDSIAASPLAPSYTNLRHDSRDGHRPSSSGREDNELAEAVGMLSCSSTSARGDARLSFWNQAHVLPPLSGEVPGESYAGSYSTSRSFAGLDDTSFISSFPSRPRESFARGDRRSSAIDSRAGGSASGSTIGDDDEDRLSRQRSDDDEDGVFGQMEA